MQLKFYDCHVKRSEIWLVLPTPGQWKSTVWTQVNCQAVFFLMNGLGMRLHKLQDIALTTYRSWTSLWSSGNPTLMLATIYAILLHFTVIRRKRCVHAPGCWHEYVCEDSTQLSKCSLQVGFTISLKSVNLWWLAPKWYFNTLQTMHLPLGLPSHLFSLFLLAVLHPKWKEKILK